MILSSWSDVFDKMMNHDFKEQTQKQVAARMYLPPWDATAEPEEMCWVLFFPLGNEQLGT